jgi:hypothetical protein
MNELFRTALVNRTKKAILDAENLSTELEHKYLIGKHKEILLDQLITPLISSNYNTGTGKVIDFRGKKSHETDLIVYSARLIAPLLFSHNLGLFPIESVLTCIEVKSKLTAKELKDSVKKFSFLYKEMKCSSGIYDEMDKSVIHTLNNPVLDIFAFDTDLKNGNNYYLSEFDRYKKLDDNWEVDPIIKTICIVNRGTWSFSKKTWHYIPASDEHEEVIGYLGILVNTLAKVESSRKNPRLGLYLSEYKTMKPI